MKEQHPVPTRTCIGCRRACPARELVRLGLRLGAVVSVVSGRDRPGGRGAWVHPSGLCVNAAIKAGAFARAFRAAIAPIDAGALTASVLASR